MKTKLFNPVLESFGFFFSDSTSFAFKQSLLKSYKRKLYVNHD